jgi:hypothetical protein
MPLYSNYNVNTLDQGRADVEFIDRTRVFLAPNTLVVIYGTASQTQVSKSAPAAVEVDAGEVKAALAALRGESVEVAIKGGGRVSAASRDTVVQRKGDRTTVAVFEGKAGVTSGGKSVEVPTNFGTRFVGVAPPAKPRPLPPAPAWASGLAAAVLVTPVDDGGLPPPKPPRGTGVFDASWLPVPKARQYRIELLRERDKPDGTTETEIVSRNEVPASITAFHGEQLEIGAYRLQVRASTSASPPTTPSASSRPAWSSATAASPPGPSTPTPTACCTSAPPRSWRWRSTTARSARCSTPSICAAAPPRPSASAAAAAPSSRRSRSATPR